MCRFWADGEAVVFGMTDSTVGCLQLHPESVETVGCHTTDVFISQPELTRSVAEPPLVVRPITVETRLSVLSPLNHLY